MRRLFALVIAIHALIHFLGVAKAFRFAELPQLPLTIGPWAGVLWGVAGLLLLVTVVGLSTDAPWMWAIGLLAAIVSQVAIFTAWREASAGTLANLLLLVLVFNAWRRPPEDRLDRAYGTAVARVLPARIEPVLVTELDLAPLPALVQRYLRVTGSVGRPRVVNFRAVTHGGIRGKPTEGWMSYLAVQVNTIVSPTRSYLMHARKAGIPLTVLHRYADTHAMMQVRLLDLLTMVDVQSGKDMDQSETVTVFNDRCVFAPASLIDPAIVWTVVDSAVVRAEWANGPHAISAFLRFAPSGELVDWWSDDRGGLTPDGKGVIWMRWSTPLSAYREFGGGRRLASHGEALWHAPEGTFSYITVEIDAVEVNVTAGGATAQGAPFGALVPAVAAR
jgi:hypothetical protein